MRSFFIIITGILFISACSGRRGSGDDITQIDFTENTLFIDTGRSSIVINNSGDSTKCYDIKSVDYSIVQISPEGEWINYVARQSRATVTCDGQEGQKRTIQVELRPVDNPKHVAYVIQHNADEIYLEHDYYQTVTIGCCDAEPIHRVYDYAGHPIIEGNVKIITGAIPNNPMKFFIGYTPAFRDTTIGDTTTIGSIILAYDPKKKYTINVLSPPLPPDLCSQYSPEIMLVPTYGRDSLELFGDEYQLWDFENIESTDEIRNISIFVEYLCEVYYPVEPLKIPITNGKPFGKDELVQNVYLNNPLEGN